jgi:hypothetical protein
MSAESGWYLDPNRPGTERYWDGLAWTKIARAIGSLTFEVLPPPNAMAEPALEPMHGEHGEPAHSTVGFELPSSDMSTAGDAGAESDADAAATPPTRGGRSQRGALRLLSVALALALVIVTGMTYLVFGRHTDADAAVADAVNATLSNNTADMTINGSIDTEGANLSFTGTGAINFAWKVLQMQVTISEGSQQLSEQAIYLNNVAYLSLGSETSQILPGKSWICLDLSQFSPGSGASGLGSADTLGNDPTAAIEALRQEGNTASDLGPSIINGVAVEVYSVHLDTAAIDEAMAQDHLPSWMEQAMKSVTNPDVDYQVSINAAGQLARLTTDVTETVDGHAVHNTTTLDFSHYDATVSVTAPPPSQVATFHEFLQAALSLSTPSTSVN